MLSRVKLIFGIIILCLLFIGSIAYFNIKRLQSGTEWIEHSHQIIHSLQKMYANLKDTQTNYADYLLTKNKSFLLACRSGMDNTRKELGQAEKLMMDDPILHKNMDELHSMVQDRIDSIQTGLAYAQAGRSDLAIGDIQNKSQKKEEQQVKQLIGQISGMQIWLLKTHKLLEETSTENTLRFMALCTLSALFICGLAAYFINRHINERQQAINLLKSSEEKLRFLAETANDSFITTDSKGNIVDLNQATEAMFGYSRPELMGRSLITLMPKQFTDEHGNLSFERYASMTTSGGLKTLELFGRRKDSTEFPLEVSVSKWETKAGAFFTSITRDISERKFFIKTLLKNEHRLFQFLDAIPVGVLVRDPTGMPYYANQKGKDLFGMKNLNSTVEVKDISKIQKIYQAGTDQLYPTEKLPIVRALAGEKSYVEDMEIRHPHKTIYLHSWGAPILDENQEIKFALSAFVDVTSQIAVNESLREREEFFRNLFEEGPIGMTLAFPDHTLVNINRAFANMLGYSKDELVGRSFLEFTHPEEIPIEEALNKKLFDRTLPKYQIEKRYITKKGQEIWCKTSASAIRDLNDDPLFCLGIVENISEQKEAEDALKKSEQRFRRIFEQSTLGMIFVDLQAKIMDANEGFCKMLGYTKEELLNLSFAEITHPEDLATTDKIIGALNSKHKRIQIEKRYLAKGGSVVWAKLTSFLVEDIAGNPIHIFSIIENITEMKKALEALKDSEEKFRAVTESVNDAIVSADKAGRIIYFNKAAVRMFGYEVPEAMGQSLAFLICGPMRLGYEKEFQRALETGDPRVIGYDREVRGQRKDGGEFPLELSPSIWYTDQGVFITAVLRDITERKQIEEMKNDLISVVSHQLKTPVAEINGYIENLLDGLAGPLAQRQVEYLVDMREIGMENYRLISDLLNMSKIERGVMTVDLKPIPLRLVLEQSVRGYEAAIHKKGLDLRLESAGDWIIVLADRDKTVETIRNILNNAIKCTDNGWIALRGSQKNGFGVVEVSDTGIGMNAAVLKKIFTKERVMNVEAGRAGAGLGLYIAKNFMELQGGDITVESEVGKGSTFRVRIPIMKGSENA